MIKATQKCRKSIWVMSGAALLIGAAVTLLVSLGDEQPPEFRLETLKQLQQGTTNVVVFRLTALDGKQTFLASPGSVSVPTPFANSSLGHWTFRSLPAATCLTNFSPLHFNSQIEFAVIAPTNEVWRLDVNPLRVLSRWQVWTWKTRVVWENVKSGKAPRISNVWNMPWAVTMNHFAVSEPFTNRITVY